MKKFITGPVLLMLITFSVSLKAQNNLPIRDNSFLVEEAFNQETGVVQHISNLLADDQFKQFIYTFTQEWPIKSELHQLSYTIPVISDNDMRLGDIFLNYRYQLVQQNNIYLAPRFSLVLPTGKTSDGNKNEGIQINIPFSYEWQSKIAVHLNLGTTHLWTKTAEDLNGNIFILNYAGGFIWLLNKNFNLMNEVVYTSVYNNNGINTSNNESLIVNPGFRAAINCKGGLQIVPGFAVPIGVINQSTGFFLYLSFEHGFMKKNKK